MLTHEPKLVYPIDLFQGQEKSGGELAQTAGLIFG